MQYITKKELLPMIDSTLLRPNITETDLIKLCEDAKKYRFAAVVVNPIHVKFCRKQLKDSPFKIKVCTVIGFPLGEESTENKLVTTKEVIKSGAEELDIVMCISAAKAGDWEYVKRELQRILKLCKKRVTKIIIETAYLTPEEIKIACEIAVELKARYIKTSTGYAPGRVDLETIALIRESIATALRKRGDDMLPCDIKASGKIDTFDIALAMAQSGVKRIGTSHAVEIAEHETEQEIAEREAREKIKEKQNKKKTEKTEKFEPAEFEVQEVEKVEKAEKTEKPEKREKAEKVEKVEEVEVVEAEQAEPVVEEAAEEQEEQTQEEQAQDTDQDNQTTV